MHRLVEVGCDLPSSRGAIEIAQNHPAVVACVAIHPNDAARAGDRLPAELDALEALVADEHVRGIGETGLDYYYEHSPREPQQELFRRHIRVARKLDLPVIIHSREADEDTIAILKQALAEGGPFRILIHCFTSSPKLAEEVVAMGGYISASGIITFKKSQGLRESFANVPLDRLLVETDSPYLAPEPHRGKPCEPAYTYYTAKRLAEIKGVSEEELARVTTENFFRLFSKAVASV